MESVPLLYHPATVLLADNSSAFLRSLALHLPQQQRAYCLYSHPMQLLQRLQFAAERRSFVNELWNNPTRQLDQQLHRQPQQHTNKQQSAVAAKHVAVQRQLQDSSRFADPFAVVLEHEMSPLSGLQLCQRTVNPFVQKILLTSCVDEQLMQRAKQQGLVDTVLYKHDHTMLQQLLHALQHAQERYFHLISTAYANKMQLQPQQTDFLADRAFRDFFRQLCQELGVVEHHVYGCPDGFVLLDAAGDCYGLCVQTKEQFDTLAASDVLQQASDEVQHDIRKRRKMLCVPQACTMPPPKQWQQHVHPTQVVSGLDTYYCACVKQLFSLPKALGFAAYSNKIDVQFVI
ncbi:MAG: hypothetical protein AAF310_03185 [Myxococcota bacterium]